MRRMLHLFFATLTVSLAVTHSASAGRRPQVELVMAVWTPGSYLVREYQRHVENLVATADGKTLAVSKPVKNRWRIEAGGAATVTVTYRVYGREMTVRNNWVEAGFAMLNGALNPAGLYLGEVQHVGDESEPMRPRGVNPPKVVGGLRVAQAVGVLEQDLAGHQVPSILGNGGKLAVDGDAICG